MTGFARARQVAVGALAFPLLWLLPSHASAQTVAEQMIEAQVRIPLPPGPCLIPSSVHSISVGAGAQIGVEAIPEPCGSRAAGDEQLNLSGLSVGDALDELVRLDPRYLWLESDGVVVVRQVAAWMDDEHPLHSVLGDVAWQQQRLMYAAMAVSGALRAHEVDALNVPPATTPQGWEPFDLALQAPTGYELLNEIARAHGTASWGLSFCTPEARIEQAYFEWWTPDGTTLGIGWGAFVEVEGAPCREGLPVMLPSLD